MRNLAATSDADVLIVGGGPAGLALACALDNGGLSSTVIERQSLEAIRSPAEDGRDIALTHRARTIMVDLGLWSRLPSAEVAPLREARVLDGESPSFLGIAPAGSGHDALGWLVPNHRIRQAAFDEVAQRGRVRLECGVRVDAVHCGGGQATVALNDGRTLAAALVVAADSRFSETRRKAGIGASLHDFGRTVVVGRVAHEHDHHGIAWECFRYGNTLALLPLNERQASAVVTVASDQAASWMQLSDDEFAARVESQAPGELGGFQATTPRHAYPLVGVYSHRFAAPRFALIGDAAVGMHPVTAHGYNFGLYGIEVLARELERARQSRSDLGSLAVLEPFQNEHRRVTRPIYLGTNALVQLFTDERPAARLVRRLVLRAANRLPAVSGLLKATVRRQLTGVPTAHRARARGRALPH